MGCAACWVTFCVVTISQWWCHHNDSTGIYVLLISVRKIMEGEEGCSSVIYCRVHCKISDEAHHLLSATLQQQKFCMKLKILKQKTFSVLQKWDIC